eukprot:2774616-Pyramimonas_sp.AAC.1
MRSARMRVGARACWPRPHRSKSMVDADGAAIIASRGAHRNELTAAWRQLAGTGCSIQQHVPTCA